MKKDKNFIVGLFGLGKTGFEHLKFYRNSSNVKKIFVSEVKKIKKGKKIVEDKNLSKFQKMDINKLVSISNYDRDHAKLVLKFYKNSNIFVEKPLCTNLLDAKKILKEIKKNKFKNYLSSNLVLRNSKLINSIYNKIKRNEFGKIYYFEGDYLYGRINKILNGWRGLDKNYSVMLGGGIHLVDWMIKIFGTKPFYVDSKGSNFFTAKKINSNDFVQSNFYFKNGAIGKITANFGCVHNHQHVIKIYGTKKTFIYDDLGPRIFSKRDPFKGIKMKQDKKLYNGKACLLPGVFKRMKLKKNFKKTIMREIDLVVSCIFADISLRKKKKIKINYLK